MIEYRIRVGIIWVQWVGHRRLAEFSRAARCRPSCSLRRVRSLSRSGRPRFVKTKVPFRLTKRKARGGQMFRKTLNAVLAVTSAHGLKLGLIVLLSAGVMLAQTAGPGTLVGTVTDTSGAVVPGASVTVTNAATSFVSKTVTSTAGAYYVPYLAPGSYRLTVEAAGFKRYVSDGVLVSAGEVPRIDVKLEVGAMAESVTVTAASPLLETETSSSGQILPGDELTKMPINEKRTGQMLFYYQGTNNMSGQHVLGQRNNMIGYTLDGVEAKEPGIQTYESTSGILSGAVDAFEEVKVYTTGSPAEVGHSKASCRGRV